MNPWARIGLTNKEICERLEDGGGPCPYSSGDDITTLTRHLLKVGELDCQEGQWGCSRLRYFRRQPGAALKKLEKALGDGKES